MNQKKMILYTDNEAAQSCTVEGWRSSQGFFYTDESSARYAGCTHVLCKKCGKPTEKPYMLCEDCRAKAEFDRYCALPVAEWDGVSMIYSDTKDKYYNNLDEIYDDCEEGQDLSELRLLICKPNYVTPLDSEYCCDEMTEDGDLPHAVEEAMEAFNKAVAGIVLSWSPSKIALKLEK